MKMKMKMKMKKRALMLTLSVLALVGLIATSSSVIATSENATGLRTLFKEEPEVVVTKSIAFGPLALELFIDGGALNTLLTADGSWALTEEPYFAASLSFGGGGRFSGTLWPPEAINLTAATFELIMSGGVNSEYFSATGSLIFRFEDDGIEMVPSIATTIYDRVIWETLDRFFGPTEAETE